MTSFARPTAFVDSNANVNQTSYTYLAFRQDLNGGSYPIYIGYAKPGASVANAVWSISKNTVDGAGNITAKQWPVVNGGGATADFIFVWNNRASLTYA